MTRASTVARILVPLAALGVACAVGAPAPEPPPSGASAGGAGAPRDAAPPAPAPTPAPGGAAGAPAPVTGLAGAIGSAGTAASAPPARDASVDEKATPDTAADTAAGTNLATCPPAPRCDAVPPSPGAARPWRHKAPSGAANHRGHDLFVAPGARQWVVANFRYGLPLLDAALADEEVDISLLRACGATWEKLGTATTTSTPSHADVDGVADEAGRLFFEIPADKTLATGRHRLRLVVAGDLSATELDIEVVPPATALFVADVDGTLTTSENAQAISLLTGAPATENPNAPQVLTLLARKGYRPLYLTARPEWLSSTTRDWLAGKGFPAGVVHTTSTSGGASGAAATTFKSDELALLARQGLVPSFAFGNTSTDADAYNNAGIKPLSNRIFYQYTDSAWNGRRVDDYASLLSEWAALSPVCR